VRGRLILHATPHGAQSRDMTATLLVSNIGFTIGVDGPGQRMVVYLKGCNMSCPWCAAPESMNPRPEVLFYPGRLDDPARATGACPYGAVSVNEGNASRDVGLCVTCDPECLSSDNPAFELVGQEMTPREVLDMALRYRGLLPGGGVTIGGGEPACQFNPVRRLLGLLKENGFHTAIETNGTNPRLPELFPVLDLLCIDLKHPDNSKCLELTGQGNEAALANIGARHAAGRDMLIRICLVPGYNSDETTLRSFGSVLSAIGPLTVEILPFHRRGEAKWRALGREMPVGDLKPPDEDLIRRARGILSDSGLRVI